MTDLYLDLMEKCLLNTLYEDAPIDPWTGYKYNPQLRDVGRDWPGQAHTMSDRNDYINYGKLVKSLYERVLRGFH